MKKVAIIPARGGSKRIPKKNIKLFCDKPIIAYSIQNAFDTRVFDEVIVSTDDKEIAEVAKTYNAKIPFMRPKELSLDTTPTLPVISHAINELHLDDKDLVCCIYPTAPLLNPQDILMGLEELEKNPTMDYAFSCVGFEFSPWRGFVIDDKKISMLFPENFSKRSQDLQEVYHDAGAFYWGRAKAFREEKMIFDKFSLGIVLSRMFVQDIDTIDDWQIAEIKYRIKHSLCK